MRSMLLPNQRQGMYMQWLKTSDIDSSTPEALFSSNNASPKSKRTQGRIFDWTHPDIPEWSYAVMQTCLVKRLRINYIHQGIPEQLDAWWKGNFVRSGRTSLKGSSFILDWFHTRIAPLSLPKSIHGGGWMLPMTQSQLLSMRSRKDWDSCC